MVALVCIKFIYLVLGKCFYCTTVPFDLCILCINAVQWMQCSHLLSFLLNALLRNEQASGDDEVDAEVICLKHLRNFPAMGACLDMVVSRNSRGRHFLFLRGGGLTWLHQLLGTRRRAVQSDPTRPQYHNKFEYSRRRRAQGGGFLVQPQGDIAAGVIVETETTGQRHWP